MSVLRIEVDALVFVRPDPFDEGAELLAEDVLAIALGGVQVRL